MSKSDFEELLLEAVDEGLSSLGESSKWAIYFHLEKNFNIEKQEIPHKIANFAEAIEQIFGIGANFLEILIMRRLYEKVEGVFEWPESKEFTFTEFLTIAKRTFQEKKRISLTRETIEYEERRVEV